MLSRPTFWLEQQLVADWPPEIWNTTTVIVGVSGGADSVALLTALCSQAFPSSGRLIVAHFNHGMRGEEAEVDARFVQRLCEKLGVACEVGRAPTISETRPRDPASGDGEGTLQDGGQVEQMERTRQDAGSTLRSEAACRQARYDFLRDVAARCGARYVATGHTADDQAETVLHRLFRGTGIAGLAGIGRFRPLLYGVALVRPLLSVRRREVLEYLRAKDQPYREDSTNRGTRFTRNRLRHEMIPRIESEYNRQFVPAMSRLATLAAEVQCLMGDLVAPLLTHVQWQDARRVTIACTPFQSVRPLVIRELLVEIWKQQEWPEQAMSYSKWQQLCRLVRPVDEPVADCSVVLPGGIVARRVGDRLTLERSL